MQTLKDRLREVREDLILDEAYQLLLERGYAEMSMDELAARLTISKATLYQHFASKQELALAVVARMMRYHLAQLESADAGVPALERLQRMLRRSLQEQRCLAAPRLGLPRNLVRDSQLCQELKTKLNAASRQLVDEAKASGDILPQIPTPVIAQLITSLFRGDYEEVLESGCCTPAQLTDTLVSIIFNGLRPRKDPAL